MRVSDTPYLLNIDNKPTRVHPSKQDLAAEIDKDGDGLLSSQEISDHLDLLSQSGELGCGHREHATRLRPAPDGEDEVAREFSFSMAGIPNPDKAGYHSFDALVQDFDALAAANPNYVQKQVLGQSSEGRDLVAYKITEGAAQDTSSKTGVVITGVHHAREWMTAEAPLKLATDLLSGIETDPAKQQRLKDAEIWVLPCVNPDGYEYSRERDNMWRKNRRPLEVDQLGAPTKAVGVDLNRNYWDYNPEHEALWRPEGDKPGVTADDFSATSDNPRSETYRGPSGASEPETKAVVDLLLQHKNIKGAMDFHSYGNDMFYPWDHTNAPPPNVALYKEMAPKLEAATGWGVDQGAALYINSGDSTDTQEANGILGITMEMGTSFQPRPSKIPEITRAASAGSQTFIDEVIRFDQAGLLARV